MADISDQDVSGIDPYAGNFPVVPKGQYRIEIYESEIKATNNSNGKYLRLFPRIIDGPRAGERLAFCDLNLWNRNEQTVQIAQRTLAQICHATGTIGARDSAAFHNKAMLADVDIEPPRTDPNTGKSYGERNKYMRFLPINGQAQPGGGQPAANTMAAVSGQARPATGSTPPWRK